jgi:hypothetical protein
MHIGTQLTNFFEMPDSQQKGVLLRVILDDTEWPFSMSLSNRIGFIFSRTILR